MSVTYVNTLKLDKDTKNYWIISMPFKVAYGNCIKVDKAEIIESTTGANVLPLFIFIPRYNA